MDFPEKVLLIDSNEEEHFIFSYALNECSKGIKLINEKNGKLAPAQLANDDSHFVPDIMILDWSMLQRGRKDVLAGLRKLTQYAQIPTVIFTDTLDPVQLNEEKELGATFFLSKPFNFADLCQKLEHLFSLDWRHTKPGGQII